MRRRELLAALAAGTSGCLGQREGSSADVTPTGTPSATPRSVSDRATDGGPTPPESPFPRRIAAESVADGPLREAFGVAADLSVPDGEVTAEETARVELALRTTDGTERSLTYRERHCDRNELRAKTGDFRLFLLPAGGDWTVEDRDCPVVDYPVDCGIPTVEETITVPADGALTWRYEVAVPPRNLNLGGCVMPGRYRFSRSFEGEVVLSFVLSVSAA